MSQVYLDSNVYIYYLNEHAEFGRKARAIFERLELPEHGLWASLFTLGELLVLPLRTNDEFRIAWLKRFLRPPGVNVVSFSLQDSLLYAHLRARHNVKPLDALHLACAASAGVDLFVTNDRSLSGIKVAGIGAIAGLDASF